MRPRVRHLNSHYRNNYPLPPRGVLDCDFLVSWYHCFRTFILANLGFIMQSKAEEIRKRKIDNMQGLFFSWGLQYYITSRCSHFAQLYPTTANQCHHAIEMLLKGFLYYRRAGETEQEPEKISNWLKNEYGHQLPKLWEAFKSATADSELSKFDQTIAGLHQFERVARFRISDPDRIDRVALDRRVAATNV